MALRVGQPTVAAGAPVRQASMQHTGPTGLFQEVGAISASSYAGPENESLQYGQDWDEFDFQRRQQQGRGRKDSPAIGNAVRFGDILTTQDVSGTLMTYRSTHDTASLPRIRDAVMRYENAMLAISTRGEMSTGGTHANWLL